MANKPTSIRSRKSGSSPLTTLARGVGKSLQWCLIFILELLGCVVIVIAVKVLLTFLMARVTKDVMVQGPTAPPHFQRIQSAGYSVQTYQMPYIVDERKARSTLIDRLLGTVDVRGNLDVLMLYTSSFPATDSAIIWKLGPGAQAIAVGSTEGSGGGNVDALNWEEFSHDLVVASHFTRVVGVYNLEGCVSRGFLPRLKEFNWRQSVTIPAKAVRSVTLLGTAVETSLWTISHWAYFAAAVLLADILIMLRRRGRRRQLT